MRRKRGGVVEKVIMRPAEMLIAALTEGSLYCATTPLKNHIKNWCISKKNATYTLWWMCIKSAASASSRPRLSQAQALGEPGMQRRLSRERIAVSARYELATCASHATMEQTENKKNNSNNQNDHNLGSNNNNNNNTR